MPIDASSSASRQTGSQQQRQPSRKSSKGVHMIPRHRSHTEGSRPLSSLGRYRDEMEVEGVLPPVVRERLFDLFAQIEKEFENLYASNLALQERVEALTERLETSSTAGDEKPRERPEDSTDFGSKTKRAAQLSVSQKIKTTYKASTSKLVSSFRAPNTAYSLVRAYRGHRDGVWEVSVSRPCDQIIGTASADHTAKLYSIETGARLLTYGGHQGSVNAVRFHPSQDLVLTASGDHTAHVWRAQFSQLSQTADVHKSHSSGEDEIDGTEKDDLTDGEYGEMSDSVVLRTPLLELTSHSDVLIAADWVAGGSQVITASWDRAAILHDAESGDIVNVLSGHDQELSDVRAHPSQRLVVTSSKDMTFRLWDFRDSALLVNVFQGHTQPVTSAVFASGDKMVSGSDDRTVRVWDMRNMRSPIATIRTDSAVNRISVSPTLNLIAIPHDNRHIRLYDINGVRIGRLPRSNRQGHTRMVCAVSWADENATCNLFSCGFDRQVLGWHVSTQNKE
ncbi:WD repeat-containing protein 37-like [Littorina saxatilis]|uniref:WD repeat-containing protein 37 n=1 Tax=Littorina saxatilis TaxID=31220 RepID=A0AAN9G2Q8_9CAEN